MVTIGFGGIIQYSIYRGGGRWCGSTNKKLFHHPPPAPDFEDADDGGVIILQQLWVTSPPFPKNLRNHF